MNPQLSIPSEALAAFCREHGIKRLAIFGSAPRDDFGPESDVTVQVELFMSLLHKLMTREIWVGELGECTQ